nr:FHA domain-containing protein [Acanthopleuribacter pedis]
MKLHVIPSESEPFFHTIRGTNLIIGRSPAADLVISEQSISRRHARLFLRNQKWFIEDLGSHNGTVVDDYLVRQPYALEPGAVIRLSTTKITVAESQEEETIPSIDDDDDDTHLASHRLFKSASEMLDSAPGGNILTVEGEKDLRKAADRLKLLNEIHSALSKPITREELLDLVLERIFGLLNPEEGAVYLKGDDDEFYPAATRIIEGVNRTFTFSRSLIREVTEKRVAALVADAETDERFSHSHSLVGTGVRSLLAAPLLDTEGSLGMIVLVSRVFVRQFSEDDMALLVSLSAIAALHLRNMMLVEKSAEQLRQLNRTLERKVQERTRELQARNEELAGLDRVVRMTNREFAPNRVVQTILEQGMILFPQTERGAFLQWQERRQEFVYAATTGYETDALDDLSLTREQLESDYLHPRCEVHRGIYLHRQSPEETVSPDPGSTLTMTINHHNELLGCLILDCFSSTDAFGEADANKLERYREHAISALAKARGVQELHDKNAEILRKQSQLIMKEKMASIGTLAAGIAHEIKNPLNFVNNLSEVADELLRDLTEKVQQQQDKLDPETFEIMTDLIHDLELNAGVTREQGRKADRIVTSMMDLAQTSSKSFRKVDFNALVEKYTHMAYHGISGIDPENHPITIEHELDSNVDQIDVAPQSISRTVLNLITNSLESLMQKCQNQGPDYQARVKVQTRSLGEYITLSVWDNGLGIPHDHRNRIFTPFFTTKPGGKNIGLGLSIAYDIVVLEHHGQFEVKTVEGESCEMVLRFPRRQHTTRE